MGLSERGAGAPMAGVLPDGWTWNRSRSLATVPSGSATAISAPHSPAQSKSTAAR